MSTETPEESEALCPFLIRFPMYLLHLAVPELHFFYGKGVTLQVKCFSEFCESLAN